MVQIYRFAAVRPGQQYSEEIPSVPYDVVTVTEARECIEKKPLSFLRVSRSDAELPGIAPDDERVYQRAREVFDGMLADGEMQRDPDPGMYIYRATQNGEEFVGLVCCVATEDYENRRIRRHELTRYDKERTEPDISIRSARTPASSSCSTVTPARYSHTSAPSSRGWSLMGAPRRVPGCSTRSTGSLMKRWYRASRISFWPCRRPTSRMGIIGPSQR